MKKLLLPLFFSLLLQNGTARTGVTPDPFYKNSHHVTSTFKDKGINVPFTTDSFGNGTGLFYGFNQYLPAVVLSGALSGDFSSLKDAFDAINAGAGSGNVTVTIKENTTEIQVATLNQTNYVVAVVPEGNRIVQGSLSNSLLILNEADNVTFNGQSLTGGQTLTLRNTNTGAGASVVRLQGGTSNNTIRKCIIEGGGTTNNIHSGGIVLADGLSGVSSSLDNIIDSNLIRPSMAGGLSFGIVVGSGNGNFNNTFTNTQITNNLIENVFCPTSSQSISIHILNNTKNTLIRGNSIYNSIAYNNSINNATYYGIRVASLSNTRGAGNTIDSNYIGGSAPLATGAKMILHSPVTRMQVIGILIQENITEAVTSVTRNVINNVRVTTINTEGTDLLGFSGIYIASANLQAFNHNTLGSTLNNSVSLATNPGSSAKVLTYGMATQVASATPIADNFLGGINMTATAPTGITGRPQFYGLFSRDASTVNLKNNAIGASVPNSISVVSTAPSQFWFYGLDNYAPVGSSTFSMHSNTVQNISGTNAQIICIFQENFLAGTTNVSGTIMNNIVSDIHLTGAPNSAMGIGYNTFSNTTSLVHSFNFSNNQVKNISATSGSNNILRAINIVNDAPTVNRIKGRIEGNSVSNIINNTGGTTGIARGINFANDIVLGDSMVIAANIVTGLTDASDRVYDASNSSANSHGIGVSMNNSPDNGTAVIRDNIIHGILSSSVIDGAIRTQGLSVFGNSAIIERNKIYDLQNTATSASARIEPILLRSRSDDATSSLVRNNMVAINTNTRAQVTGLRLINAAAKSTIYHNSILLEGTSDNNSYVLLKDAAASADVKNNILYNALTGTGAAFAIGLQTNKNGYTGSNNYLISTTANLLQVGATSHTLASWQTATMQEENSQQGQSGVTTNPANLFLTKSTATLLINTAHPTEPAKASNKGMALSASVPDDFLYASRSITTPDIGAHEFVFADVLPVRLLAFGGTKQNNDAVIKWLTADEVNVNHFEVERSDDGQAFKRIGSILPGGGSYSWTDLGIFNSKETVYYRMKSMDNDTRFTYSNTIRLTNSSSNELSVFPNPVKDLVTISGLQQNGTISLLNPEGKLLKKQLVTAPSVTLDLSLYSKGIYLLQYNYNGEIKNVKIVKE